MTHHAKLECRTDDRAQWIDITDAVRSEVAQSGVTNGVCIVNSPHTTAGITLNENADPAVGHDFFDKLTRSLPQSDNYRHAEMNSDSHIKASLVGFSIQVPVIDGRLVLGTWQGMYFCEFDGPRRRRYMVTVVGE